MEDQEELRELGYETIACLGVNEQAARETYLAIQIELGTKVVIKLFNFNAGGSWQGVKDIEREIEFLQCLNHPNIPKFIAKLDLKNSFGLVMNYCDALNIENYPNLTFEEILHVCEKTLNILTYLQFFQPPIFHRDIKPSNILFDRESREVYLVDFGIARNRVAVQTLTTSGTFGFMPLEGILGQELNKSSDLYSLGVTLVCLLTLTRSLDISRLLNVDGEIIVRELIPDLDPKLAEWLSKLVAQKSRHRWQDAQTALGNFHAAILQGRGYTNAPVSLAPVVEPDELEKLGNSELPEIQFRPLRHSIWMGTIILVLVAGFYYPLGIKILIILVIINKCYQSWRWDSSEDINSPIELVMWMTAAEAIGRIVSIFIPELVNVISAAQIVGCVTGITLIPGALELDDAVHDLLNRLPLPKVWHVKSVIMAIIIALTSIPFLILCQVQPWAAIAWIGILLLNGGTWASAWANLRKSKLSPNDNATRRQIIYHRLKFKIARSRLEQIPVAIEDELELRQIEKEMEL
jgi:serine/threonine protein kinase